MRNKGKYLGVVHLKKRSYVGERIINQIIESQEAIRLGRFLLVASEMVREDPSRKIKIRFKGQRGNTFYMIIKE